MFKSFTEGLVNPEAAALQNKLETVNRTATELPAPGQKLEPAVNAIESTRDTGAPVTLQDGRQVRFHPTGGEGRFVMGEVTDRENPTEEAGLFHLGRDLGPDKVTMEHELSPAAAVSGEAARTRTTGAHEVGSARDARELSPDKVTMQHELYPADAVSGEAARTRTTGAHEVGSAHDARELSPDKVTMEHPMGGRTEEPLHATLEHLMDRAEEVTGPEDTVRTHGTNELPTDGEVAQPRVELPKTTLEHRFTDAPEDGSRTTIGNKLPEGRLNPAIFGTDAAALRTSETIRATGEHLMAQAPSEINDGSLRTASPHELSGDNPAGRFTAYGQEDNEL